MSSRAQERHRGSDGERARRREGRLDRTRALQIGNAEFVPGMGAERVVCHQLVGDLRSRGRLEAPAT